MQLSFFSFFSFLEISGVNTPNPFDHMRTAAMLGGPSANIRPTPPAAGLFITSGVGPYVGFFYAVEVMKKHWPMFRLTALVKIHIKGLQMLKARFQYEPRGSEIE